MALGGPEFFTFIIKPTDALRERMDEIGGEWDSFQPLLLNVRRCDAKLYDDENWGTEEYRVQVQLGILAELYELVDDEFIRLVFGKTMLSIGDVETWWDVSAIEYDDVLDLGLLFSPPIEKANRLPATGRSPVDEWLRSILQRGLSVEINDVTEAQD